MGTVRHPVIATPRLIRAAPRRGARSSFPQARGAGVLMHLVDVLESPSETRWSVDRPETSCCYSPSVLPRLTGPGPETTPGGAPPSPAEASARSRVSSPGQGVDPKRTPLDASFGRSERTRGAVSSGAVGATAPPLCARRVLFILHGPPHSAPRALRPTRGGWRTTDSDEMSRAWPRRPNGGAPGPPRRAADGSAGTPAAPTALPGRWARGLSRPGSSRLPPGPIGGPTPGERPFRSSSQGAGERGGAAAPKKPSTVRSRGEPRLEPQPAASAQEWLGRGAEQGERPDPRGGRPPALDGRISFLPGKGPARCSRAGASSARAHADLRRDRRRRRARPRRPRRPHQRLRDGGAGDRHPTDQRDLPSLDELHLPADELKDGLRRRGLCSSPASLAGKSTPRAAIEFMNRNVTPRRDPRGPVELPQGALLRHQPARSGPTRPRSSRASHAPPEPGRDPDRQGRETCRALEAIETWHRSCRPCTRERGADGGSIWLLLGRAPRPDPSAHGRHAAGVLSMRPPADRRRPRPRVSHAGHASGAGVLRGGKTTELAASSRAAWSGERSPTTASELVNEGLWLDEAQTPDRPTTSAWIRGTGGTRAQAGARPRGSPRPGGDGRPGTGPRTMAAAAAEGRESGFEPFHGPRGRGRTPQARRGQIRPRPGNRREERARSASLNPAGAPPSRSAPRDPAMNVGTLKTLSPVVLGLLWDRIRRHDFWKNGQNQEFYDQRTTRLPGT